MKRLTFSHNISALPGNSTFRGQLRAVLIVSLMVGAAAAGRAQTLFGSATIITPGNNSGHAVNLTSNAAPPTYSGIDFPIPSGLTFAGLTDVATDYKVTAGDCKNGSPRFQINIGGNNVFVYIGPFPNFTGCAFNTWISTGNLLGYADAIFDTSQYPGGNQYSTYAQAIALLGSQTVTGIQLVVDSGYATPPTETIEVDNIFIGSAFYGFDPLGPETSATDAYQISYAANLNIGDSIVNLSNSGAQGGFQGAIPATSGNICVNVYTFDPAEEEVSCCACLVTPNALNPISATNGLLSNDLTAGAVPTSIVIKLVSSQPGQDTNGKYTVCNPTAVTSTTATVPYTGGATGSLAAGLIAWNTTLEPTQAPGAYADVRVPFKKEALSLAELTALTSTCNFIQVNGSGFGICRACRPVG